MKVVFGSKFVYEIQIDDEFQLVFKIKLNELILNF